MQLVGALDDLEEDEQWQNLVGLVPALDDVAGEVRAGGFTRSAVTGPGFQVGTVVRLSRRDPRRAAVAAGRDLEDLPCRTAPPSAFGHRESRGVWNPLRLCLQDVAPVGAAVGAQFHVVAVGAVLIDDDPLTLGDDIEGQ